MLPKRGPAAKLYDLLQIVGKKAVAPFRSKPKSGEARVAGMGFYGWGLGGGPGNWQHERVEQVAHYKHWVYRCVNFLSKQIAQHPPKVARITSSEERKTYDFQAKAFRYGKGEQPDPRAFVPRHVIKSSAPQIDPHEDLEYLPSSHPLNQLLRNPNGPQTGRTFREEMALYFYLCGVNYTWKVEGENGGVAELWNLPAHWVTPVSLGKEHLVDYYRVAPYGAGGIGGWKFSADEIIEVKNPHPQNKLGAQSPLQANAEIIDQYEKTQLARFFSMVNGANVGAVVQLALGMEDPNPDTLQRFEAEFLAKTQGERNFHRPIVLPPGATLVPFNAAQELAFLQSTDQLRDYVVSSLYGLSRAVLGTPDGVPWATFVGELRRVYQMVIGPDLMMVGDVFTEKLANTEYGNDIRIFWELPSPQDDGQRLQEWAGSPGSAVSVNEYRQNILQLDPLDGDEYDHPASPAGMVPGGMGGGLDELFGGGDDQQLGGDTQPNEPMVNPGTSDIDADFAKGLVEKSSPPLTVKGYAFHGGDESLEPIEFDAESYDAWCLKAGFTGTVRDSRGRQYHYVDGKRVSRQHAEQHGDAARSRHVESATHVARAINDPGSLHPGRVDELATHLDGLTRDHLRNLAKQVQAKLGGKKAELVQRLLEHVKGKAGGEGHLGAELERGDKVTARVGEEAKPEKPKEPHEMTRGEYLAHDRGEGDKYGDSATPAYPQGTQAIIDGQQVELMGEKPGNEELARNTYRGQRGDTTPTAQIKPVGSDAAFNARTVPLADFHKGVVESALSSGKPVPAAVLADYPDLAAKYPNPQDKATSKNMPAIETAFPGAEVGRVPTDGGVRHVVTTDNGDRVRFDVKNDGSVYLDTIDATPGSGRGTALFGQLAKWAGESGVTRIDAMGAKSNKENGYYTLPRWGFDAELPDDMRASADGAGFSGAGRVSDLMSTPEGQAWWKENGKQLWMTFDPTPGSPSRSAIDGYAKSKSGFTGLDANGHRWENGKQVGRGEEKPKDKETHEMTRDEFRKYAYEGEQQFNEPHRRRTYDQAVQDMVAAGGSEADVEAAFSFDAQHKRIVGSALAAGKKVPPEVLADYPDLAGGTKQPTLPKPTPKPVSDKPKIEYVRAPAGGKVSDVDGEFYRGGQLMPVHGLYSGQVKPPKGDGVGGDSGPVKPNEDAKGKPRQPAQPLTPEQIEDKRRQAADQKKWDEMNAGPLGKIMWLGNKPNAKAGSMDYKGKWKPFVESIGKDGVKRIIDTLEPLHHNAVDTGVRAAREEAMRRGDKPLDADTEEWSKNEPKRRAEEDISMFRGKKHEKDYPGSHYARQLIQEHMDATNTPGLSHVERFHRLHTLLSQAVSGGKSQPTSTSTPPKDSPNNPPTAVDKPSTAVNIPSTPEPGSSSGDGEGKKMELANITAAPLEIEAVGGKGFGEASPIRARAGDSHVDFNGRKVALRLPLMTIYGVGEDDAGVYVTAKLTTGSSQDSQKLHNEGIHLGGERRWHVARPSDAGPAPDAAGLRAALAALKFSASPAERGGRTMVSGIVSELLPLFGSHPDIAAELRKVGGVR